MDKLKQLIQGIKDKLQRKKKEEDFSEVEFNAKKNGSGGPKKIIKVFALVLAIALIGFGGIKLKNKFLNQKNKPSKQIEDTGNSEEDISEKDIVEDNDDIVELKNKNIIAYNDDGKITLFNDKEEKLDEMDLSVLKVTSNNGESLEIFSINDSAKSEKKPIKEEPIKEKAINANEDNSDKVQELKNKLLVESSRLTVAISDGEDSEKINEIKSNLDKIYQDIETLEKNSNDQEATKPKETDAVKDAEENTDEKLVESKGIEKLYVAKDGIIFRENDDKIIFVNTKDNKLQKHTLLAGPYVEKVVKAFFEDNKLYLTTKEREISIIDLNEKNQSKEILEKVPEEIVFIDNNAVFSNGTKVYIQKLFLEEDEEKEVKTIDLGEKTENLFIYDNDVYVINDFGKGKDNSILAKINMDDKTIENVMELKGKRSKFVDVNGDILFVEQMDSLKEINLKDFKPMNSYSKEVYKSNSFINDGFMYEFSDSGALKYDIKNDQVTDTNIIGFDSIYLIEK